MIEMAVCQNLVPLVNIKIAGKWMFIPLKMVLIGIDPYPNQLPKTCRLTLWSSNHHPYPSLNSQRSCYLSGPMMFEPTLPVGKNVVAFSMRMEELNGHQPNNLNSA